MLQIFCPKPAPAKVEKYPFAPFAPTAPRYAVGQTVWGRDITEESFDTGDPDRYVWYQEPAIVAGLEWNLDFKRWDYALYYPDHDGPRYRVPIEYGVPEDEVSPR